MLRLSYFHRRAEVVFVLKFVSFISSRLIFCRIVRKLLFIFMQVLDRGEKIELLVDKTENLHQQVNCALCLCICIIMTEILVLENMRQDVKAYKDFKFVYLFFSTPPLSAFLSICILVFVYTPAYKDLIKLVFPYTTFPCPLLVS